jgi:hypothetical protein
MKVAKVVFMVLTVLVLIVGFTNISNADLRYCDDVCQTVSGGCGLNCQCPGGSAMSCWSWHLGACDGLSHWCNAE